LQTANSDLIKIRLLKTTPFVDTQGKGIRDSQLRPGDLLLVEVNLSDAETAKRVTLLRKATETERVTADRPIQQERLRGPEAADLRLIPQAPSSPPRNPDPQTIADAGEMLRARRNAAKGSC
jgi:hypothetical protein